MMMYIWIAFIVIFGILEAVTAQLVSIWFVIGAVASLGAYFFGASTTVQFVIFVLVSVVVLLATRPLVKKFTKTKIQPTNADSYVGLDAVVTEEINNLHSTGAVKVRGVEWSARSADGETIAGGETVTVVSIEGVKLIVNKKQ